MIDSTSKTIYLVSVGIYSDRRIIAAFETEQEASDFCSVYPGNGYDRPEVYGSFILGDMNVVTTLLRNGYRIWHLFMRKNGDVPREPEDRTHTHLEDAGKAVNTYWIIPWVHGDKEYGLSAEVWAKSEEGAIKTLNECRIQLLAMDKWELNAKGSSALVPIP